jgi:TRAP-type C4-dicarboxylate transport system permease small subunit
MMALLNAVDRQVERLLRFAVVTLLAAILVLLALGALVRIVPLFSMSGYDELVELLIVWLTFAGAVALWREGALFRVDFLQLALPPRAAHGIEILARLLMLTFAVAFAYQGWVFTAGSIETTPFLRASKQPWYAAMPIRGALMVVYGIAGVLAAVRQACRPQARIRPSDDGAPS